MFEVGACYEGSAVFDGRENIGSFLVVMIDEDKKIIVLEYLENNNQLVAIRSSHKRKFLEPNINGNEWIIYQ